MITSHNNCSDVPHYFSIRRPLFFWFFGLFISYITLGFIWYFFLVSPQTPLKIIYYRDLYQITSPPSFLEAINRYDVSEYLHIAQSGYLPGKPSVAFFPVFPFSLRQLSLALFQDLSDTHLIVCGLLISAAASYVLLIALDRFCQLCLPPSAHSLCLFLWVLNPTSVFLAVPYTESLFLALTLWGLLQARQKRLFSAGMLIGLACLTRPVGILAYIALLAGVLAERKGWEFSERPPFAYLGLLLPALAILSHMGYFAQAFHDPFASLHAEQNNWNQHFLPFWSFPAYIAQAFSSNLLTFPAYGIVILYGYFLLLGGILLSALVFTHHEYPVELKVYTALVICSILFRSSEMSMARLLMAAFPLYMALAAWIYRKPTGAIIAVVFFTILNGFGTAAFICHKFFF